MDLLGRKMDREGVRTVGTIERVVVTERGAGGSDPAWGDEQAAVVYLWVRFTDQRGIVHTQEMKTTFRPEHIPPPGGEIEVRYMPKDPTKFHTYGTGPVDPSVPRGWSAGIFEVEDLGGHHAKSFRGKRTLDRQRELFRTGQRAQAEVVSVTCVNPQKGKRSVHEYSLVLRAGGREIETRAWVPFRCLPQPGDLIQIALSAGGSEVALDTDERYDGPPGQALVFTTPPELTAQAPPLSEQIAAQQAKLEAVQERNAAGMARYQAGMTADRADQPPPASAPVTAEDPAQRGTASAPAEENPYVARLRHQITMMKTWPPGKEQRYNEMIHKILDAHRNGGMINDAEYERLLREARFDS